MQQFFQNKQIFLHAILLLCFLMSPANAQPFGELIPFWQGYEESSTAKIDHSVWQDLLNQYLNDEHPSGINRFDYERVSNEDQDRLRGYLAYMQSLEPREFNRAEQQAYWINLYNAATVNIVKENIGTITSIRQIRSSVFRPGPWKLKILNIAKQKISLDDIEHGILRPIWQDNRIHYAVNCASLGCPNLLKTAFTADNTEQLLEQAAADFINNPRGVNVSGDNLTLSSIFDWYKEDFGNNFSDLREHIVNYAKPELAQRLKSFSKADYDYDWSLNR